MREGGMAVKNTMTQMQILQNIEDAIAFMNTSLGAARGKRLDAGYNLGFTGDERHEMRNEQYEIYR